MAKALLGTPTNGKLQGSRDFQQLARTTYILKKVARHSHKKIEQLILTYTLCVYLHFMHASQF